MTSCSSRVIPQPLASCADDVIPGTRPPPRLGWPPHVGRAALPLPPAGGGAGRARTAPRPRGGGGGGRWERLSGRRAAYNSAAAGGGGGRAGALGAGGAVDAPSRLPPQRSLPLRSSLAPPRRLPHRLCGPTSQTLSPQTLSPLSRGPALSRSPQRTLSPHLVPQRPPESPHILAPHSTPFSRVA